MQLPGEQVVDPYKTSLLSSQPLSANTFLIPIHATDPQTKEARSESENEVVLDPRAVPARVRISSILSLNPRPPNAHTGVRPRTQSALQSHGLLVCGEGLLTSRAVQGALLPLARRERAHKLFYPFARVSCSRCPCRPRHPAPEPLPTSTLAYRHDMRPRDLAREKQSLQLCSNQEVDLLIPECTVLHGQVQLTEITRLDTATRQRDSRRRRAHVVHEHLGVRKPGCSLPLLPGRRREQHGTRWHISPTCEVTHKPEPSFEDLAFNPFETVEQDRIAHT